MSTPDLRAQYLRMLDFIPHMGEIGLQLLCAGSESVEMALPYREDWLGDIAHGLLHPGIITTLVDSCSGLAVMAHIGKLEAIATLDLRMDYLHPAVKDHTLHCRSRCYRMTTNIAFARADVWQAHEPGRVIATSQGVFMRSARGKERHYA